MDKNIIKNHLIKRFISEESTPGISVTDKAKKESEKINKAGVKAIEKDMTDYDKSLKQKEKNMSKMATNKYNYTDAAEKTYHDEMEILNGQEMIEYSREPGSEFQQRAEEAIVGSSRMGNAIGGNAEAVWGASSDDFGKKLVKRIKDSSKKRAEAEIQTYGMGDVQIPTGNKVQTATTAISASKPKGDATKPMQSASEKPKTKTVKENNDNNNSQIKESMKRLKFKKEFEGANTTQKIGHALTLIPEGYRVDKKEFEMTDGTVTCKVRWEGNLNEGKAVILLAADKTKINEDISRMKALMGYKSEDTLGLVKGNKRLDENAAFADIWKKSRQLLGESEEIEGQKPATGDLDDAVKVAPEAKKNIEGSASTEKGTKAPAPKKGPANAIDKAVSHAPEAKKHVEGAATTSFAQGTDVPKPAEGEWEEINMPQAAEAKKHVESGKATHKATDKAQVVKENEEVDGEDDADVEVKDDFGKPDPDDDDSSLEKEPSVTDIKPEVPPTGASDDDDEVVVPKPQAKVGPRLMQRPSTGEYFLTQNNKHLLTDEMGQPIAVPAEYVELAKKNPKLALEKIQDAAEMSSVEEPLDEYGDEHPIATSDAVSAMKK